MSDYKSQYFARQAKQRADSYIADLKRGIEHGLFDDYLDQITKAINDRKEAMK